MKRPRSLIASRYLTALRSHLNKLSTGKPRGAQCLGKAAMKADLKMLDLALIHEEALQGLQHVFEIEETHARYIKRAGAFFVHVLLPLETSRRDACARVAQLKEQHDSLLKHTAALARGKRRLEAEVKQRKAGEAILAKEREEYQQLFAESQLTQKKLRHMTRQIIMAQEEERKEISRELHDGVVQTLVGINVELSALGEGASSGLRSLKAKIARTQRLVENSVDVVHRFARELRPAVLDDLGLIPALQAYSKNLSARKKINIQLTAFKGVEELDGDSRTVMFRVAQEAMTNVVRHAQATKITLSITKVAKVIRMEISDNGRSFQVEKVINAKNQKRLGLIGMKERIEMIGGTLRIESTPGRGTSVRAEIPFNPPQTT